MCMLNLSTDNFSYKVKAKGIRAAHCKKCQSKLFLNHYHANKQYYVDKARKNSLLQKTKARKFILAYLQDHHCVDCGENDPIVLEFDHRDPKEKISTVSHLSGSCYNIETIRAEIAKCDVRCANCHIRRTHKQFAYYSWFKEE